MGRKLEPGQYFMTDITSGNALDLRHDNQMLYAYSFHGENNQQARLITLLISVREELTGPPSYCPTWL